jgi:hypothetical protein
VGCVSHSFDVATRISAKYLKGLGKR